MMLAGRRLATTTGPSYACPSRARRCLGAVHRRTCMRCRWRIACVPRRPCNVQGSSQWLLAEMLKCHCAAFCSAAWLCWWLACTLSAGGPGILLRHCASNPLIYCLARLRRACLRCSSSTPQCGTGLTVALAALVRAQVHHAGTAVSSAG